MVAVVCVGCDGVGCACATLPPLTRECPEARCNSLSKILRLLYKLCILDVLHLVAASVVFCFYRGGEVPFFHE